MVWKDIKHVEPEPSEPKIDLSIFRKRGNSKTFPGWLIGKIKQARVDGNMELVILLTELYNKYKQFETENVKLKNWKGKSGIKLIVKPNHFIVVEYRKADQDSDPEEVKTEILKEEVNEVITALNQLDEEEPIPTRKIAESVYNKPWKHVFSDRRAHINLTLCLRILDYYKIIKYRAGKSTILDKVKEIQEKL